MNEWLYTGSGNSRYSLKYGNAKVARKNRLRFQFSDPAFDPTTRSGLLSNNWSWYVHDAAQGIWDMEVNKSGTNWESLFYGVFNTDSDKMGSVTVSLIEADTTGITDMNRMFTYCTQLTSVPLFDTSSVTDIFGMFSGCTVLTSVPLFDTSSATNMGFMFAHCANLTAVPLFVTSSATDTEHMFWDCASLTAVPLLDTSSVTNMKNMFSGCASLESIPLFNTSAAINVREMFSYCTNVQSGALAIYQQMSAQTNPPSNHTDCFLNCGSNTTTGAAELASIPASWGGTMA